MKIAEAVLIPVYGEKQIESERPFVAKLKDGIRTVDGTLHCPNGKSGAAKSATIYACDGGTAQDQIAKDDARVLYMTHYQ